MERVPPFVHIHIFVCVRVPVYVTHETTKQCWRCHEICNARQNLPVLSATGPRPFLAVPAPRGGKFAANLWVLSVSKCLKKVVQDFPEKNLENTMIRFRILEQLFLDFRGKSDRSSIAIMGVEPTWLKWTQCQNLGTPKWKYNLGYGTTIS